MNKVDWGIAILLFIVSFISLAATSNQYGLAWDEPYNYYPALDAYQWLKLLFTYPTQAISDTAITQYWKKVHEHPSVSKLIAGITHGWFSHSLGDLYAFRLGEFILFSLLIIFIYLFAVQLFNRTTAIFSALAFLLMPRIFGQAHFATTDIPTVFFWFLTIYCFYKGLKNWKWSVLTGIVWGLALATKINALFLPIPLLIWAQLFRRKEYGNNAFCMLFISPVIFFLSWPWLWFHTKQRIMEYLLFYTQHKFTTVYYFGKTYLLIPAPWHYPLVYTVLTIPLTLLFLITIGIISIRSQKSEARSQNIRFEHVLLILFNALFPILLQSFPASPKYDGIRLFLPAFPYLAILAGLGFNYLTLLISDFGFRISDLIPHSAFRIPQFVIGILYLVFLVPPLYHVINTHPYQLSYYNLLIGGVKGAHARGMESTYWCEAVNREVLAYLNKQVPENGKLRFLSFSDEAVQWYQEHGYLRKDIQCFSTEPPDYYVLLCRQGFFGSFEWYLYKNVTPIKSFSYHNQVPLVSIYPNPTLSKF